MMQRKQGLERCVTPVGAPRLARDGLLREEPSSGNHRKAAVGQLLLLHDAELLRVLWLEAERVEGKVSRVVAFAKRRRSLAGLRVDLRPALGNAGLLGRPNASEHHAPDPVRKRRDLVDGRAAVGREERMELLLNDEAERRQHGHAPVSQLRLAKTVHLELVLALEEASRVELAEDVRGARKTVGKGRCRLGGSLGEATECSSRHGDERECHCSGWRDWWGLMR